MGFYCDNLTRMFNLSVSCGKALKRHPASISYACKMEVTFRNSEFWYPQDLRCSNMDHHSCRRNRAMDWRDTVEPQPEPQHVTEDMTVVSCLVSSLPLIETVNSNQPQSQVEHSKPGRVELSLYLILILTGMYWVLKGCNFWETMGD